MKTAEQIKTEEIRMKAIRVINRVITLKYNVFNGCYSDKAELEIEENRLAGIKAWAEQNNQLQEIKAYFASKNFGQSQFQAAEIAAFFNN
jgi:hypothetical protein